jgi:hypothetical protein
MTTSAERIERIEVLTPRQALDTLQYMTAWFDEQSTDPHVFAAEQQIEILNALFQKAGYTPLPLSPAAQPDEQAAGQAARKLLMLLTESDDGALLAELDYWLANPPEAETKAFVEVIVLSIVLTACIKALRTRFEYERKDDQTTIKVTSEPITDDKLAGFYGALETLIGLA